MEQIYFNKFKICLNLAILLLVLLFTSAGSIYAQTPVVSNFTNFSYTERTSPVYAAPGLTVTNGSSYNNGYIRFELPVATGDETLALTSAASPTTFNAISTNGSSVYLGQGGGSKVRIGEIDAIENGQNGQPLKVAVTFERSFPNASFEDGIDGWTVYNQAYYRQSSLNGMLFPIRPGESCAPYTEGSVRVYSNTNSYYVGQTTSQSPPDGGYCIMLQNNGSVPVVSSTTCYGPAYSIFGPSIISDSFNAYNGDKFSVEWKAVNGSDWYDVIGYLLGSGSDHTWNTADDSRVVMFSERGSVRTSWTTSQITIPSDGEYKFEFVSGSFDRSGGGALGATLYVDNLQLISGAMVGVSDANMQQIARQVTYQNNSCEPTSSQSLTISVMNTVGNSDSQTATAMITEINCPPLLAATAINPALVENTPDVTLFNNASASNIETGQTITDLIFTVSGVSDGSSEKITIDGSTIELTNGQSGTTSDNALTYSVSVTGTLATVSLSKSPGISQAALIVIMNSLEYGNDSGNPTGGNRTISLTFLKDDGGTANGGVDQSTLGVQSVVNVKPAVNIAIFSGNNQTDKVTSELNDYIVLVTTSDGFPVSGRNVSFTLTTIPTGSSGEALSVSASTTDSQGKTSTKLTLGIKTGNYIVSAVSAGLSGSPNSFTSTAAPESTDVATSELTVDDNTFTAGSSVIVTITPRDVFSNPIGAGLSVVIKLDSLPSDASGPISVTDNGDGTYSATVILTNTGAGNIISAVVESLPLSSTADITLNPAPAHDIIVAGVQTPQTYGDTQDVTITIKDDYGNVKTDYTGLVTFSSTDVDASVPADYTFLPADAGVKTIVGDLMFGKAGTFTLTASESGNPTITGSLSDILVNKKTLTVTSDTASRVYGTSDEVFSFSYGGFLTGDDESILQTEPVATTTTLQSSPTGFYSDAIIPAGGADPRYDFNYVPAGYTITKAMLTVSADAKSKVYGDANPILTLQYSGYVLGEDEAVLDTKPTVSTFVTEASASGVYVDDITVQGAVDNNYDFTYMPADFTVEKATLTVTSDDQEKVYGSANPVLSFTYDGFIPGENESALGTKPFASSAIDASSAVGVYTGAVIIDGGVDNNYQFIYVPGDFSIIQATLTVTADSKSKVYGEDNPELTLQYSGFVNGEDESVIDTKPSLSTTVTTSSVTGLYTNDIMPADATDANYDFNYMPADFTVTKAMLTVSADTKTKVYGDANPGTDLPVQRLCTG